MKQSFYLAYRYLRFHASRTLILISCLVLIALVPLSVNILTTEGEKLIRKRSLDTELILGAKGSTLDLVMNSLYFQKNPTEAIPFSSLDEIFASDRANGIPLYVRFEARGFPIVGTSIDYFSYRKLKLASGEPFGRLGQCVVGSKVAERLQLKVGDALLSSPENLFDLAGVYPLKMEIVGILEPSGSSDDQAILVDVKTAWVIQGLVHGHQDLEKTADNSLILAKDSSHIAANAKLYQFNEITDQNIDSFHFHGDTSDYPLSAVIVLPFSSKDGTLLEGDYLLNEESKLQLVRPKKTIEQLLANIFKTEEIISLIVLVVGFAALLALGLVYALSMKLRRREMETYFKMGCSRNFIFKLYLAEISLLLLVSLSVLLFASYGIKAFVQENPHLIFSL